MGLPGAGKTTLIKDFLHHLRKSYPGVLTYNEAVMRSILQRDDGLLRNIAKKFSPSVWEPLSGIRNALSELHQFSSNNVELFGNIFSTLSRETMSLNARQCIVYTFYHFFSGHQLLQQYLGSDDLIVAEEGFAQAGSMLFGYLPSRTILTEEVIRYVDLAPKSRALIWIDTPVEHCLSRLKLREELPIVLQKEHDGEILDFLCQAKDCFESIYSQAARHGPQVYRVDNPDHKRDLAVQMLEEISEKVST